MTPKEKAYELIGKYIKLSSGKTTVVIFQNANKCALIAVEEILNLLFQHHEIDYWKEVKKELEAMK